MGSAKVVRYNLVLSTFFILLELIFAELHDTLLNSNRCKTFLLRLMNNTELTRLLAGSIVFYFFVRSSKATMDTVLWPENPVHEYIQIWLQIMVTLKTLYLQ